MELLPYAQPDTGDVFLKKLFYSLFFLLAFAFCWTTDIANRTEADDAFNYAYQVEHNGQDWLYHPHHMLYGAISRFLYNAAGGMGYGGRAYPMLCLISALCAAGSVLVFFQFCYHRFSMRPVSSLLCSGLLLFSYGFWRYANEAEVIVPACFTMLCALYFAVAPNQSARRSVVAGMFCGGSILLHVMNVVPVFLAVPLFYALNKNRKGLALYMLAATAMPVAGYAGIYCMVPSKVFSSTSIHVSLGQLAPVKGIVGFSQCIASANFMMGYQAVRDALAHLFPSRMLLEEFYMGRALPIGLVVAASFSMAVLFACFAATTGYAFGLLFRQGEGRKRDRVGVANGWQTLAVALVWFLGYAGAVLLLEPGNPEVWVMGLVPFWLVFCGLIVAPLSRQNVLWPVLLLVVLLGLHNYIGGIRPLQDPLGDYNRQKAKWVLENSVPDDLVITAGNPVFVRYLRYYSKAGVLDLNSASFDELHKAIRDAQTVFVLNDVFDYIPSMRVRFPAMASTVDGYAAELKPKVRRRVGNEFGGVWELVRDN